MYEYFLNVYKTMNLEDFVNKVTKESVKDFFSEKKTDLHNQIKSKFFPKKNTNEEIKNTNELFKKKLEQNIEKAKYDERTENELMDSDTWEDMYKPCRYLYTAD